jgi:hypothetical protein
MTHKTTQCLNPDDHNLVQIGYLACTYKLGIKIIIRIAGTNKSVIFLSGQHTRVKICAEP